MHITCLEKIYPPIMYTSKKPTVFTYCYLYMHGYRASIGAWIPQSPLSVAFICVGIEPSIGAWVPQSSLSAICMCMGIGPSIGAQIVS